MTIFPANGSSILACLFAAIANYTMCTSLLFKHRNDWSRTKEIALYSAASFITAIIDTSIFMSLQALNDSILLDKLFAASTVFFLNFGVRKYFIFYSTKLTDWNPQTHGH